MALAKQLGRMGITKNCILIVIKRGWHLKAGSDRITPYQSEDTSRFELFCLISKCLQLIAQDIYLIYLHTELYQRKIVD